MTGSTTVTAVLLQNGLEWNMIIIKEEEVQTKEKRIIAEVAERRDE